MCANKEVEANMANNRRSKKELAESYLYFDEELYKDRFVIERTNAWLDGFKGLLMRFEKKTKSWMAQHWLVFCVLLLHKLNTCLNT